MQDLLSGVFDGLGLGPRFSDHTARAPCESLYEVVFEARRRARRTGDEAEVGSEHLLWGLAAAALGGLPGDV